MSIIVLLAICYRSLYSQLAHIRDLLSAIWEVWSQWYSDIAVSCHSNHTTAFSKEMLFLSVERVCLPLPKESWEQKWVMLWISAAIFVKGIKPPNLQGQFMPIMFRAESFLCDPIIASRPQFLWTIHQSSMVVPIYYITYSALTPSYSERQKYSNSQFPLLLNDENFFFFLNYGVENTHRSKDNSCSSNVIILNSIHHFVVCSFTFSHWSCSSFSFFASTSEEHINHVPENWQSMRLQLCLPK